MARKTERAPLVLTEEQRQKLASLLGSRTYAQTWLLAQPD